MKEVIEGLPYRKKYDSGSIPFAHYTIFYKVFGLIVHSLTVEMDCTTAKLLFKNIQRPWKIQADKEYAEREKEYAERGSRSITLYEYNRD